MKWIVVFSLLTLAGIFAGLTLALFSLDLTALERKAKMGDLNAKRVYGIRKDGNLLLCTLLLSNVASYTSMAVLLGSMVSGVVAGFTATALIFIFGEILPQAIFPRYALAIGSKLAWLVKGLMVVFYPISAPLAWALDKLLGQELPTIWSKREIKEIIKYHEDIPESIIDQDEERIVLGALSFSDRRARNILVSVDQVYCLEWDRILDKTLLQEIKAKGFSRIPVYKNAKSHVVGVLHTSRLLGESLSGKRVSDYCTQQHLLMVNEEIFLDELLNEMLREKEQMALIMGIDGSFSGIITIEDIVENILQTSIEKM